MKLGMLLFLLIPIIGHVYVFWHVWNIVPLNNWYRVALLVLLSMGVVALIFGFSVGLNIVPFKCATYIYEFGTSSIFVLLYAVMLFLLLDLGRLVRLVPKHFLYNSWPGTLAVVGVLVAVFVYGNIHYHHKQRQELNLNTSKNVSKALKVVMVSDLHLGYHNRRAEFARWVDLINAERPDLVLIAGDIIDISIRPLEEENVAEEFRRIKAPIYACLGNHEYMSGEEKAERFYREARINLLRDSVVQVKDLNIVGRDDRTNRRRTSLKALMGKTDPQKYTILLDHQPYHLEEAQRAGVDFQLSGHTHYGQVWPISWIEDAMYEKAYGPLTKGNTRYFVTSGMGIWGGKFRIGTRSEYLVATITKSF